MVKLKTPLNLKDVLRLKVGSKVELTGRIFTARDKAHEFFVKEKFEPIKNSVIYHCGPIVKKGRNKLEIVSAGPTTSNRVSSFIPQIIKKYSVKAFIGKGGLEKKAVQALNGKAVYLAAVGGAAVLYAKHIKKVENVFKQEFGTVEAVYELFIEKFPVTVAIDSKGNSLYENVFNNSKREIKKIIKP